VYKQTHTVLPTSAHVNAWKDMLIFITNCWPSVVSTTICSLGGLDIYPLTSDRMRIHIMTQPTTLTVSAVSNDKTKNK
jgi:hypothetical protein